METLTDEFIKSEYEDFILTQNHPCIMANTMFQMNNYHLKIYDDIASETNTSLILSDINTYLENYDFSTNKFESLIVCFTHNNFQSELDFEKALWDFLQRLHDNDDTTWDPSVSEDPDDPNFSFSLKGKAFYVIGLHPNSSRMARQAPYCTVVFNLHWQFERLREMGTYQSVRDRIRRRDEALQGTVNPVLTNFGQNSETRQYSGRNVEQDWKCPFHHNN
jgi:FPC/CPF motif-containing protein YcgG